MTRGRRFASIVLGLATVITLGFVVAVASRSRPGSSGDDPLLDLDTRFDIDLGSVVAWIIFIMAVLGAVLIVVGLKEAKPRPEARRRNWLGILLGIVVFLVVLRYVQPVAQDLLDATGATGGDEGAVEPLPGGGGSAAWLFSLLVAAIFAAALTRVGLSVRHAAFDDPEPERETTHPSRPQIPVPVTLPLGEDPKSRVLGAYHRFEDVATTEGHARLRNETALKHARRVAASTSVDDRSVMRLAALFSKSRFGLASVTEADAHEAEGLSERLTLELES